MKTINNTRIIGIDHGFGNIKTANCCFPTGVIAYDCSPTFTRDMLVYDGRHYIIGKNHKAYNAIKLNDEDYYILTLAAIASELQKENLTEAAVHLAVGLPLTWLQKQKDAFRDYLMKNKEVIFQYQWTEYHITFEGVNIFPQGFAAIAPVTSELKGLMVLADIGNGTMNVLHLNNGKPDVQRMYTEVFGTHQCVKAINDAIMQHFQETVPEAVIMEVLKSGKADIAKDYLKVMQKTAEDYVQEIFNHLKVHEYNPNLMKLLIAGGGGCLVKNFGKYDPKRVTIIEDICATAKGYEFLAERYYGSGVCK